MKKNLRNVLALALGLMTTVSFAQDWNVDSRTRIDMSGDNDKMITDQRATVGATWGGSNWGIHVSNDVNYTLGLDGAVSMGIYEAYASADLMGYANMTMGRMAWDYGSGAIVGSNQWGADRNTRDGFVFDVANDMLDLSIGMANINLGTELENSAAYTLVNASKSDGDWSANLLYVTQTGISNDGVNPEVESELTAMGIDLGYSMMGGALDLSASMNSASDGTTDADMTSYGATYNVNDNMSVSASQTTYGENGFGFYGSNMGDGLAVGDQNSWMTHGNIGYLGANEENLSFGLSYDMGGISLGVTMHSVSNSAEGMEDYERNASEFSLGYSINDNASLSLSKVTDNHGLEDDTDYMWLTLSVTP